MEGAAGLEEPLFFAVGIGADEGEVEDERVLVRIIRDLIGGVVVDFEKGGAGFVGKKVHVGRLVHRKADFHVEVLDIPGGDPGGFQDVEGDVFEFHGVRVRGVAVAAQPSSSGRFGRVRGGRLLGLEEKIW